MAIVFKAHFDGRNIVPDEPVDLPVDQQLEVQINEVLLLEREAAWQRLKSRKVRGSCIPLEAIRRENLYEDRL